MNTDIRNKILQIIGNQHTDEKEILHQLKNLLYENEARYVVAKESKSIADLYDENIIAIQDSHLSNTIKSGFKSFDDKWGGFSLGELAVIGGRPSMGKTQLMVNLSLNMSQHVPVLYFTFDLNEHLLTARFVSSITEIPIDKILHKELTDFEKEAVNSIGEKMKAHQLFINDSCNNSMSAFKVHCIKQIEEKGIKVIMVDYLQMISSNKYRFSRVLEISHISRELKNIVKDYNVCIIAASQLSRAVESRGGALSKRAQLSDLRESGAIEQDADKVIFIYRPEYYGITQDENGNDTQGQAEILMAKNRNGILDSIKLRHGVNFSEFDEVIDNANHERQFEFKPSIIKDLNNEAPF